MFARASTDLYTTNMAKQQQLQKKLRARAPEATDPSPTPSSDVIEQQARKAFTKNAIRALLELQSRPAPDPATLASRAWDKMQWDLPLLSSQEVDALAQTYRNSVACKGHSNPPPHITPKLLSNVTQAVLAAAKPSKSAASTAAAAAAATSSDAPPDSAGQPALLEIAHTSQASLAAAYQRLSAVLLLNVVNAMLNASAQDAFQIIRHFPPCLDVGAADQQHHVHQVDALSLLDSTTVGQAMHEAAAASVADAAAVVVATRPEPIIQQPGIQASGNYVDVEATEQDDDETVYEPLNVLAPTVAHAGSDSRHGSRHLAPFSDGRTLGGCAFQNSHGVQPAACHRTAVHGCLDGVGEGQDGQRWEDVQACLAELCSWVHLSALTTPLSHPQASGSTDHNSNALNGNVEEGGTHTQQVSTQPATKDALSNGGGRAAAKPVGRLVLGARNPNSMSTLAQGQCASQRQDSLLWESPTVQQALLQLIRTMGVHTHACALQPLLAAYIRVALEWMEQTPTCIELLLSQIWDTLGVTQIARMPRVATQRGCNGGSSNGVLLPEVLLSLSMVLQLARKLPKDGRGRAALWQQVNTHLLPLLARCLADVAVASSQQAAAATSALDAVCQVIVFYICHRPGNFKTADALQSSGVLRGMCALWSTWAGQPSSEALRHALLLCVACSPACLNWALAVPGFKQALSGSAFQSGGCAEAHGAAWQLLTGAETAGGKLQLEAILEQGITHRQPQQVQLMHDSLQLMRSLHQASDGHVCWGPSVQRAMHAALSNLKQRPSTAPSSVKAEHPSVMNSHTNGNEAVVCRDAGGAEGQMNGLASGSNKEHLEQANQVDGQQGHHLVTFEHLQVQQWEAGSVAALKDLLGQGAKKD